MTTQQPLKIQKLEYLKYQSFLQTFNLENKICKQKKEFYQELDEVDENNMEDDRDIQAEQERDEGFAENAMRNLMMD